MLALPANVGEAAGHEDTSLSGTLRRLLAGAAAGAAGTTALNAVTYADMVVRGRAASSTPQDTVEKLAGLVGVDLPGDAQVRGNRLDGLGALGGLLAGTLTGVLLGAARAAGWRAGMTGTFAAASGVVLVAGNGPMTVLGITDPRTWDASAWLSDLVPHLAYAAVAAYVLTGLDGD